MVEFNLLKNNKSLMKEYNYNKNQNFDINKLTLGSDKKIWWICENGHEWEASIGSRNRTNAGCPICSNKIILKGYNDLETLNPTLSKEWNYKRNEIGANEIGIGSNKKVWWQCEKGHEWQASVVNRLKENGTGCPYCTNQKILKGYNDLETLNPSLVKEWNYEKNSIKPYEIGMYSSKKVWWKCEKGHEWEATIDVRSRVKTGCPFCCNKKILKGYNDFLSNYPQIAKEWNYEKNQKLLPEMYSSKSNKKVWWKCEKGHEWEATISNRVSNHNCPFCNKEKVTSFSEKIVYFYIKKYFPLAIDNYKMVELGKREIDIFIPNLMVGIEYDGGYYHDSIENDLEKDKMCDSLGIKLYRIRDNKCKQINSTSICYYRKDKSNKDLEEIINKILLELNVNNVNVNIDKDLEEIYLTMNFSEKAKSLYIKNEKLIQEWNYEKNGNLTPEMVSFKSNKKVWWKCNKNHEWQDTVNHRSSGRGCPYCSNRRLLKGYNDLLTKNPKLAKEWNYSKNNGLLPSEVFSSSSKIVWWKCSKCGYEWKSSINNLSKKEKFCAKCKK